MIASPLTVAATCNTGGNRPQVTAGNLTFGNYNAASSSPATTSSTITIRCNSSSDTLPSFNLTFSKGSSGSYATRTMKSGGNSLNYNFYTSTAYSQIWGDGTGGSVYGAYSSSSGLSTVSTNAFGRVPTGQYVTPGSYTDTITVTVTY